MADWLLWEDPSLTGQVAYDTSFELLPVRDLQAFSAFYHGHTAGYTSTLDPYSILVLDPTNHKESHALLGLANVRVVLRTKEIIVATKPTT